jgi:hypothetical protein
MAQWFELPVGIFYDQPTFIERYLQRSRPLFCLLISVKLGRHSPTRDAPLRAMHSSRRMRRDTGKAGDPLLAKSDRRSFAAAPIFSLPYRKPDSGAERVMR